MEDKTMIHKTIQKQSTTGKQHVYQESTTITTSPLIRDQLIQVIKQNAVGSENKAVDQGDRYVIYDILRRKRLFTT
jgi:hypothetical protein